MYKNKENKRMKKGVEEFIKNRTALQIQICV